MSDSTTKENEVRQTIEQFLQSTDVDVHHIVVPSEMWDDAKEYAEYNGESGFDKAHLIEDTPVRWRGSPQNDVEAVVKLTDNEPMSETDTNERERTDHPDVEREIKQRLERELGVDPRTASRTAINWYVEGILDPEWEPTDTDKE